MVGAMKRRAVLGLSFVLLASVGLVRWLRSDPDARATRARHLVNRVWVERMPEDSRDVFGKLLVLDTPDGRIGVVGRSSTWTHRYEVFLWRLAGDRLSAFFPQHGVRDRVRVRTWDCAGEAPEPFELCLELSNERGRARFYSMRGWEVRPHGEPEPTGEPAGIAPLLDAARTAGHGAAGEPPAPEAAAETPGTFLGVLHGRPR